MVAIATTSSPGELLAAVARRYCDADDPSAALAGGPTASLAEGAAGVAYFLLRHGSLGGGARLLEAAVRWAAHAELVRGDDDAFTALGESQLGDIDHSLHYGPAGVWWVRALVAAAAKDADGVRRAVGQFVEIAQSAVGRPGDVCIGSAGLLLACAQLVQSIEDPAAVAPVRAAGDRLAADLLWLAERRGPTPGDGRHGWLGAAHGWSGVAQALLRWGRVAAAAPPAGALVLLEKLAALRRRSGRWPIRTDYRQVWRGWCHGSAGWAQMWTLAWECTGETRFLDFAVHCAADGAAATDDQPHLCCGRAGQAFTCLTLYRATGELDWLASARRLEEDAVRGDYDSVPAHKLFHGELGIALLAAEIEHPSHAAMPVYELISLGARKAAGP